MKLLKSLKIEEIVLICISLFFLILLFNFGFFGNSPGDILKMGWANVAVSINWWMGGMIISLAFFILQGYVYFIKKTWRRFFDYFSKEKISDILKQGLFLFRILIILFCTTALGILLSGVIQQTTKDKLINDQILNADKFLVGGYPLLELHYGGNPFADFFNFLTPAIIYSFLSLAMVMGFLAFIFYFSKDKTIFRRYIMSIFIAFAMAMPLWYFFPANAPVNYLLHGDSQNFEAPLSQALKNYQPNASVKIFQDNVWERQKNALPITTMPSMHWAWSIMIVYYLFKKWPKTIFLSSAWVSLDLFGTIYLGGHYLIDGLAAIPLAVLSILLAKLFLKIEQR